MTSEAQQEQSKNTARAAGRGGIAVLGAKAFFIVSGLVQQTLLPRAIGLAGYGALSRVLGIANILNNVVVSTSIQGVSRAVARARGHDEEALRATLRVHVPTAVIAGLLFAASAPLLAAFQGAAYIAVPLAIVAGVVVCYGIYAPLVGALNGRAQFTRQASLDVTFAVLRTVGLAGGGWLFATRFGGGDPGARVRYGVIGATLGFVSAAFVIIPLAMRWTGIGRAPSASHPDVPRAASYLNELWPLALAQLCTNAVMQIDLLLIGRFLSQGALGAGLAGDAASKSADEWVAVYRACQLFAFLPYQLLFSITQVLFPMLARAKAERDEAAVRVYVARGARLGAIACGLMVSVVAGAPGSLIGFLYGSDVAARGEATLRLLALGQGAFAILGIGTTVLASLGRERMAAIISFGSLAMMVTAIWLVVPSRSFGEAQLLSTAISTSIALACGLAAAAVAVTRAAGAFVPVLTAVRVGAALALAAIGGLYLPRVGFLLTPLVAIAIAALYILFLVVTGELGKADIASLRALAGARGKAEKAA